MHSIIAAVCRLTFRKISALEFDDPVTAVIKSGGVQVGQTLTYSVNSYIYSAKNDNTVPSLGELLRAIYNYGESAKAYKRSKRRTNMKRFEDPTLKNVQFAAKDILTASTEPAPTGGGDTPSIWGPGDPLFKGLQEPEEKP